MTEYNVTAEFSIGTMIEPEGLRLHLNAEYDDNSYWGSEEVTSSGGSVSFKVEAEDEADAERKAEDVVYDGMEVEDDNGLTWVIESISYEIEAPEMDKERAKEIVTHYLDNEVAEGRLTEDQQEAFRFLLDLL